MKKSIFKEIESLFFFSAGVVLLFGITALIFLSLFSTKTVSIPVKAAPVEFQPAFLQENSLDYVVEVLNLSGGYDSSKAIVLGYLAEVGEDVATWERIIEKESKFQDKSTAPTFWSKCDRAVQVTLWGYLQPANNFIELRDYPNGIWQATCEELGAVTVESGYSSGLTHIIEPTWREMGCTGDILNWKDNLNCAIKIKNARGWYQWSSY